MYIDASRGSPSAKPPMWAIDPGISAYNCLRHGMPLPVLAMPMWEGAGNRAIDLSINRNHGVINGAEWSIDNLEFNGTTDYVNCGDDASLQLNGNSSFAAMINFSGGAGVEIIISNTGSIGENGYYFAVYQGDLRMQWSAEASYARAQTTATIPSGWAHVAGTYDGNEIELYINGIQQGLDLDEQGSGVYTSADTTTIGARDSGLSNWFTGEISQMYMYDTKLSPTQVKFLSINPHFMYQIPEEFYGYSINNPIWYYEMLKRRNQ